MCVRVSQRKVSAPQVVRIDELPIQAGLQAVVESIADVLEFRHGTKAARSGSSRRAESGGVRTRTVARSQIQDAICGSQNERIDIDQ